MRSNGSGGSGWEQLFRLVFETTSNPVVLLDTERRIVDANDAAVALWGGSREDLVGTSITQDIKASEQQRALQEWKEFRRTGEYSGSRALLRADGSEVQVDFAARQATVLGRRLAIYVAIAEHGPHRVASLVPCDLPLTPRENEVVTLIVLGRGTREIASALHISVATVRTHVRNAMAKLGVHSRAQLVAAALCQEDLVHRDTVERGQ